MLGRWLAFCRFKKPIAARLLCVTCCWALRASAQPAPPPADFRVPTAAELPGGQQPARNLDRVSVVRLASAQAPNVQIARARTAEARALREGAGVIARSNPDVGFYVGPRWFPQQTTTDFNVALSIPIDISGAPALRATAAEERVRLAEADADLSMRHAVAEALDLWARARAALERVSLENARTTADDELLRAARVRRTAGVTGDGELALVEATRAQSRARKRIAEGESAALLVELRARLGLPAGEPIAVTGGLAPPELPPLADLIPRLPSGPAAARARAGVEEASANRDLQSRLAFPEPRVNATIGKDPERYAHFGMDVPLPIFQRNQTNRAVAEATVLTARTLESLAGVATRSGLEAAYATYLASKEAFGELERVKTTVDDAEHLAFRGFELGQSTLLEVLAVRRETVLARSARLEAELAYARAAVAVELAAGLVP